MANGVALGVGVIVRKFVGVGVTVSVPVGVDVGVSVAVGVGVEVGVLVGVLVAVGVGVDVGVLVAVGVGVAVGVLVGVGVSVICAKTAVDIAADIATARIASAAARAIRPRAFPVNLRRPLLAMAAMVMPRREIRYWSGALSHT